MMAAQSLDSSGAPLSAEHLSSLTRYVSSHIHRDFLPTGVPPDTAGVLDLFTFRTPPAPPLDPCCAALLFKLRGLRRDMGM